MGRGTLWKLKRAYLWWRWQHMQRLAKHYLREEAAAKADYDAHARG